MQTCKRLSGGIQLSEGAKERFVLFRDRFDSFRSTKLKAYALLRKQPFDGPPWNALWSHLVCGHASVVGLIQALCHTLTHADPVAGRCYTI